MVMGWNAMRETRNVNKTCSTDDSYGSMCRGGKRKAGAGAGKWMKERQWSNLRVVLITANPQSRVAYPSSVRVPCLHPLPGRA